VLGRYAEAVEIVSRGLEQCGGAEAGNVDLLEERALSLVGLGLLDEGRQVIRDVLILRKNTSHIFQAALILTSRKQFTEALELFESLEADARRHVDDLLSYRRAIRVIQVGRRVFEESRLRAKHDSALELLETSPYAFRHETPLDELPSLATVTRPTKCYVLDDPGTGCPGPQLPPDLHRLVEQDLTLLRWTPGRKAQQICFQYLLPDCFIYDDNGGFDLGQTVVMRTGRFIPELIKGRGSPLMVTRTALWAPEEALEPIDLAFVTLSVGWKNYGHVVAEILSTLAIYERLGLSCPIIVPGPLTPLHAELVRASGIPDDIAVLPASEVRGRLIRLAVCPQGVSAKLLRDWCSTVVRHSIGDHAAEERDQIVYISRANSKNRPLANEQQLEEKLRADWNCQVVHMEELSHVEQLKLVQRARIIIGPHGAGLTASLFAPQTTTLIELLPNRYPNRYYAQLAAVSNRLYLPIFGAVEETRVANDRDLRWRIDPEKVGRVIDLTLEAATS
jgi:Glycosyltransferase 61